LLIATLREELPPKRLTGAMALISGMISVGAGVGVAVTGFFMRSGGDYHQLFWLSTALTVIGLLAFLALPRRAAATTGRIDWTGAAVLGLGLALLVMPLEQGNAWGWGSPATLGSLAGAAVLLTIFVLVERRVAHPLGVMFGYAALPALVVEHVNRSETGIANSVNSIARSVGMSLGTAFVVALLARNLLPGAPLPDESQFTLIFVIGAVLSGVTALVLGLALPRSRPTGLTVAQAEEEEVIGRPASKSLPT
jgi:hypothetical protein